MNRLPHLLVGKKRNELKQKFRLYHAELIKARKMQLALLRQQEIKLPDSLDVGVMLRQSRSVGGDLYMFSTNNNCFQFFIADVCGKGMTAALYMSSIHHILITMGTDKTPADYCNNLNKELCRLNIDAMFISMICGRVNLKTGEGLYVNAGHVHPIYWSAEHEAKIFPSEIDVPIGVIDDYHYENKNIKLNTSDTIILYTDGILDSINENDESFGKDRLLDTIHKCKSRKPADIVAMVSKELKAFHNHVPQSDDMILMAMTYNGDNLFHLATVTPTETINQIARNPNEDINEIQVTF